jgi:carboxypeptidase Q
MSKENLSSVDTSLPDARTLAGNASPEKAAQVYTWLALHIYAEALVRRFTTSVVIPLLDSMRVLSNHTCWTGVCLVLWTALALPLAGAQNAPNDPSFPTADSVVQRIYMEGMHHSQAEALAQVLMDSIGPRLTGSPANRAANDWLVRTYAAWGVPAHKEQDGRWLDWTRGPSHIDLLTPRVRTLEATALAWSPATPPGGVTGAVVALPPAHETHDSAGFARWLKTVRGKFVLINAPQLTCRPDTSWAQYALPAAYKAMHAAQDSASAEWDSREAVAHLRDNSGLIMDGVNNRLLRAQLEAAGVAGILTSWWSGGWGVDKIEGAGTTIAPAFDVSCEDYSLLARLAAHGQHPSIHAVAETHMAPEKTPVYSTIAELKGTEYPDQYVMLSAHLDSWDGGSGATDNGTDTIMMLEAMRILKLVYPHPKRTILVAHWSGEEEMMSGALAAVNKVFRSGLQVRFDQDAGTGRITEVSSNSCLDDTAAFIRWMSPLPASLTHDIRLEANSDNEAPCHNAPAFFDIDADLTPPGWDNNTYTWHTNRDTFDKLSFDDIERNATLIALLAYEASEDPHVRHSPPPNGSPSKCSLASRCEKVVQRR